MNNITKIIIPKSVSYIDSFAFTYCYDLLTIEVAPDNLDYKSVDGILYNKRMTALVKYPESKPGKTFIVPSTITQINPFAFLNSVYVTEIKLPDNLTYIGEKAFFTCEALTTINLPKGISVIPEGAFTGCRKLKSIDIPDGVTAIEEGSFDDCSSLVNIQLPKSLRVLGGKRPFFTCTNFQAISIDPTNGFYSIENGVLFDKNKTTLIRFPQNHVNTEYIIPKSVIKIAPYAFSDCKKLSSVIISDRIVSLGEFSFWICSELKEIEISPSVTIIDEAAFGNCEKLQIKGYTGTFAQQYAEQNKINFINLGFIDIKGNEWYFNDVTSLVYAGIITGFPNGQFKSNDSIKADQFLKAIICSLGYVLPNGEGYWASSYIDKARQLGLIDANEFTTIDSTKADITRCQMAKICETALKLLEGTKIYTKTEDIQNIISDSESIKATGNDTYVYHMWELGLITGYPDLSFKPNNRLSRAEAVTVIIRLIDPSKRKPF